MASTSWAAELPCIHDETGRIAEGLVVLESNPLDNIEVLTNQRAIRAVIKASRVVRSDLSENED